MKIYIYGVKFEGNFVYVGQTFQDIRKRWWKHQSAARNGRKHCPKLYNHMRKHGVKNYSIELIETCQDRDAADREIYWISKYKTFESGLNCHPGGNQTRGKYHYSYGNVPKAAIAASVASRLGTKHSPEHVEKIRQAHLGRKQPQNYISVICDQNGKTYESMDAAAKDLKICNVLISGYLKGKSLQAGGYTFKYSDTKRELKRTTKKAVGHWNKETHPDASKKISEAQKLYNNRIKNNPELYAKKLLGMKKGTDKANSDRAKKIKRGDGIEFSSIADAARSITDVSFDYARSRIRRSIKEHKPVFGYSWI